MTEDLESLIGHLGELPTIPLVVRRINAEVAKESLTSKSLGQIITMDPSLSAKVLRLANSAFYGLAQQVETLEKAVTVLGINTIKNLTLSISIYSLFDKKSKCQVDLGGLWLHSLGTAVIAKTLVERIQRRLGDEAFLAGLLHDIGKTLIIEYFPDEVDYILSMVNDLNKSQKEVEQEVLAFTHQKAGSLLLKQWNFPENHVAVVLYHHDPLLCKKKTSPDLPFLLDAVFAANQMAKAIGLGTSTDPTRDKVPPPGLEAVCRMPRKHVEPESRVPA